MILGGGPNRIGQGIEFDYCCVHAAFALREDGFETIMVNSNPETFSTDYDTSDKLFFEPLTLEDVLHIYEREQCWGAIAQFGGQTPLNLALGLQKNGVNIIGTSPQSIEIAEDRKLFAAMLDRLKIPQPPNGLATNEEEALAAAKKVSYPVLVRPSFVLGGRAMQIVYSDEELRHYMRFAVEASPERTVPFVSKAIGRQLAKLAAKVMTGMKLPDLGFTEEIWPKHFSVKESVFPFSKFPGQDILLGPEMRSTGEVMGIGADWGEAYAKSQMAAQPALPMTGKVFISVRDSDKANSLSLARELGALGFELCATNGTARVLGEAGLPVQSLFKLAEGRPNVLDLIKNGEVQLIIN